MRLIRGKSLLRSFLSNEKGGGAFVELGLALPFMMLLTTAAIDVSEIIHTYFLLSEAAHETVRYGTGGGFFTENKELQGLTAEQECDETGTGDDVSYHNRMQRRFFNIVSQELAGWESICIATGARESPDMAPERDVYIKVAAKYEGRLPIFKHFVVRVAAKAPHVFGAAG